MADASKLMSAVANLSRACQIETCDRLDQVRLPTLLVLPTLPGSMFSGEMSRGSAEEYVP